MSNRDNSPILVLDDIFIKIGFGKFHVFLIFIIGITNIFDAVELILLSFLGPILNCIWKINIWQSSFLIMAVFIGMMFGSTIFGKLCDIYGRKFIILICICIIIYFGSICAASPTIAWIVIIRFIIGLAIGGLITTQTAFLTEIIPMNNRGSVLIGLQLFWSLGGFYLTLVTVGLYPIVGLRWWMFIAVIPFIVCIPLILWLPESPRYLLLSGKKNEALKIINFIAKMNKTGLSFSKVRNIKYKNCTLLDLFHSNYAITTVIVIYLCFTSGSSYYGFVIASSVINAIPHRCLQNMSTILDPTTFTSSLLDDSCCYSLTWYTMQTIFIAIFGEIISSIISMFIIKFIRRKLYFQILLIINAVVFILLNFCLSPAFTGILIMFGRGSSISLYGVCYLYTSEVFPTSIRGLSIGIGSSSSRIGAIISSFLINIIMVRYSFLGCTIYYFCINVVAFVLIFILPYETKDRQLLQSVEDGFQELQLINSNN